MKKYRPDLQVTNSTIESMLGHHSVRSFEDLPVDEATLAAVLSAAQSAPTSSNQNGWSVVVIRDPERLRAIEAMTGRNPFISQAPVFLVWIADLSRIGRLAAGQGSPTQVFDYQEAVLLGAIDAILAAQSAVIAAESLGLGTCYVGGVRSGMKSISELLSLPYRSFPVVGLALGWPGPDDTAGTKPRLPLSSLVFEERYDAEASDRGIAAMDRDSREYNESQGRDVPPWSELLVKRWSRSTGIANRLDNRDFLRSQGFADR